MKNTIFDLIELIIEIQTEIALNEDLRTKEVGDIIIPWDGSSLTDLDGKRCYIIYEPFLSGKFIVTAKDQNVVYDNSTIKYVQDLIITEINSKQQFRINSDHVKLVEN